MNLNANQLSIILLILGWMCFFINKMSEKTHLFKGGMKANKNNHT